MTNERSPLLPDRHPQKDLFVCDIVDAVPKGDMSSMEHPVFSLSTKPDMRPREYKRGENWIGISPSRHGLATVHDRDVLIYCISQCMAALNEGRQVHRTMRFKAYDLLVATNRQTSGRGYELLKDSLRRLQGTQIETNLRQGGKEYFRVFGLIDSAEIVKETRDGRMLDVEITLSDWVFDAIENNHVLTLNRGYFFLRKPLERRVYELARKHCGRQPEWRISLATLHKKTGSTSPIRVFRAALRRMIEDDNLPDYRLTEEPGDVIRVTRLRPEVAPGSRPAVSAEALDRLRELAPGHDVHALEAEWLGFWESSGQPRLTAPDRAFLAWAEGRLQR